MDQIFVLEHSLIYLFICSTVYKEPSHGIAQFILHEGFYCLTRPQMQDFMETENKSCSNYLAGDWLGNGILELRQSVARKEALKKEDSLLGIFSPSSPLTKDLSALTMYSGIL